MPAARVDVSWNETLSAAARLPSNFWFSMGASTVPGAEWKLIDRVTSVLPLREPVSLTVQGVGRPSRVSYVAKTHPKLNC